MTRSLALAFALGILLVAGVAAAAPNPEAAPLFAHGAQCAAAGDAAPDDIGLEPPAAQELTCTAQQTCPNDCFIHCTGQTQCTVGATSVTCDGNQVSCPYPTCGEVPNCLDNCGYCACISGGGGYLACHAEYCSDTCWPPRDCY